MKTNARNSSSAFFHPRALVAFLLLAVGLSFALISYAANPAAGALGPSGAPVTWTGTGVGGQGDISGTASGEDTCVDGSNCDTFKLTLTGSPADWTGKKARVQISWASSDHDYDVFIHKGTVSGAIVAASAQGGTKTEVADIDPNKPGVGTGDFIVHVVYFSVPPVPQPIDQYSGRASVVAVESVPDIVPPPLPPGTARMSIFMSPPGFGDDAGEPSIGSNWKSEKSFSNSMFTIPNGGTTTYYGGFDANMLRITFNDCSSPAKATWENKPLVLAATPRAVGDPILFTDSVVGRTFVSQEESAAGSTTDITDNDGDTFMPSQGAGGFSGFDHQTIASGPYHGTPPPTATWPSTGTKRAVYYAAQSVSDARTSRSDDGGVTFLPSVPMYTTADCGGLHGHLKVTPDTPATRANGQVGTVYVPNNACGGTPGVDPLGHSDGQQAAIVSEDNGITWSIRPIPGSDTTSNRDPSIGIATDGTVYFGMQSKDGHARISVSKDQGRHWTTPVDVGAQLGIQNIVFPAVVAGDPDRAAFAFYGSTTAGDHAAADFPGVWYLYISVTYDGGKTWATFNATPNDPVQRGGICNGTSETCRNLLDFFDATIDKEGRILVGYDDGCIGSCVDGGPNSFSSKAAIARQSGGKRMFAAFDPVEPALPGAPRVSATADANGVLLTWPIPDDGGSAITKYRVYRGTASGAETFLADAGTKGQFLDVTADPNTTYFYRVTAVNSIGEGPYCGEVSPVVIPAPNPCAAPGVTILTDKNGDLITPTGVTSYPSYDLRKLSIAEPFGLTDKLVFTLKVENLQTIPPNARWPIQFRFPGDTADTGRWVDMHSDATGAVGFSYGTFVITNGAYGNPNTTQGAADTSSTYSPDGTITIVISRSKIGGPAPGTPLQGFLVRVRINNAVTPDNMPDSLAPEGSYNIVGNDFCRPNNPPIAVLRADKTDGGAPLTVTFDASASADPDAGDTIASYTFDFGDGSPGVVQSSPIIQHTYQSKGSYFARVRAKDSRNVTSKNAAVLPIDVGLSKLLNISSRLRVQTGDNVMIGGFIVTGSEPKKVLLRAIGPSLTVNNQPLPGRLADPTLELFDDKGTLITANDNWKDSAERADIEASGIPPTDDHESAISRTLNPGSYTAIIRGKNATTGIGLIEVYDRNENAASQLGNISTRGFVESGDNVLIGGFIVSNQPAGSRVLVRALGPSLKSKLPAALNDPTLGLFDANGTQIASNDNWKDTQRSEIEGTGIPPTNDWESALVAPVGPANYTAVVRGKNGDGIGLVEVYNIP